MVAENEGFGGFTDYWLHKDYLYDDDLLYLLNGPVMKFECFAWHFTVT